MPADPLLDLIDEHIAAIEATLPHDLTKINAGSAPLGLEALVVQSLSAAPAEQGSFGVAEARPQSGVRRVRLSALVGGPAPDHR
jgi:hypothetical protein